MPVCQLTQQHYDEASEMLKRFHRRPGLEVQLTLVAALDLLAQAIAGDRSKCIENTLAMLAQLEGVRGSLIQAVRAECDRVFTTGAS